MERKEMTSTVRRILALLLCWAMCMTVLPTAVYSDGGQSADPGSGQDEDEYVLEGVYDWPYGDNEYEHTVYYRKGQYPNGLTVSDSDVGYFSTHCQVAMTNYNDNDHLWEGYRVSPTCTDMGMYIEECLFCHAYKITYQRPTGHQRYRMISSTEPTCTQEGADIYKCQWCDAKIKYSTPAKGHYWVLDETKSEDPTIWKAGHYDYKCARDGCDATRRDDVPALGGYKLPKIREQEMFGQNTYNQYFRTWHGIKYSDIWGIDHYDECQTWTYQSEYDYLNEHKFVSVYNGSSAYYNDQIVITGAQISLNESRRDVAVLYAQDTSSPDFGTMWADIVIDTTETDIPLEVYLVDFGITKDGKRTKGIASLTVKGNGVDVYFVNSNIGFIDYRDPGTSSTAPYSDSYVMRGNYVHGDTAYIALDGYDSHIYMGPDVNLADPKDAHVKVSVRARMLSKADGDKTTLWYNSVNPYEKYWFMMEGIYGTSFTASFEYVPTVELSNLTMEELGVPKKGTMQVHMRDPENGAFISEIREMSYADALMYDMTAPYTIHNFSNESTSGSGGLLQNGVFDQLSGAALYNCDWHVGTVEVKEFAWISLSNSDLAKYRCSDCGYETSRNRNKCPACDHENTLVSTSSQVNLHNRARLTIGGNQTCDITTYGTNRIYLDDAKLTGNITAAGHSDDVYNSLQVQPNIYYNGEREDILEVLDNDHDKVPDVDLSKDIYHSYLVQKAIPSLNVLAGYYYFMGSDLTLYLSGDSTITSPKNSDISDYYPAIMVDREAILKIEDDPGKSGVGTLSIDMPEYESFSAAIGGTPNADKRPHGWIMINGGILNVKGGIGAAAIGGSNSDRFSRNSGHISVNGGVVNAVGRSGGAAIGGAIYGSAARTEIDGGTVNAKAIRNYSESVGAAIGGGAPQYRNVKKLVGYQMVRLKNADGNLSGVYVYIDDSGVKRYTYEKTTQPQFATFTDSNGTVHTAVKNAEYVQYPGVTFELDEKYAIYADMYEYVSGGFGGNISISGGSVVTAWSENPGYVEGSGYSNSPEPVDKGTKFYHALATNQTEPESYTSPSDLYLYDYNYGLSHNYHDFYYSSSSHERDDNGYFINLGKYFTREMVGNDNVIVEHPVADLYTRDGGSFYNGKTAGYVIGATCYEATHTYGNRISMSSGKGYNPLIIIGQEKTVGSSGETVAATGDHYYLADPGILTWTDNSAITDTCDGRWIPSGVSHLAGIILIGYDTGIDDYVVNSTLGKYGYKVHGQIDLPDLGSSKTLELKKGTTLTLTNGSVMNVPDRFEITQEDDGQLVIEEGCVVQGKGMWPGKPADPANPPSTEQVKSILERLKTESPEEEVATHLAIVQTANGESTVIDGTSAEDVRQKMKAALLTENAILTIINAGTYGFKKVGNVWKLKTYDPKMVVSLIENGALSASPGKYTDNTKRFDVQVCEADNHVTVTLQSARLSTPEYKIYDGRADDQIVLNLGAAGSQFAITVELDRDQVINNKCIFNVPKFAGSEFSLSTIKVLRNKCSLRYSGTMKFSTPVMDVAGININELQINYANGSKLGGINGSGYVKIPSIAGFPVKGSASMKLNTFAPNRELSLSVELETPIFEGAFEASFKETRGIIMIDTLYAEIAAGEGGIPLVPPTVIGYLQGGGLGFTGLADTISMDSFGAPPIRLKIAAKGSIMDVIEGWARLSIGPSGFDLELTDIKIADANFIKQYGVSASWDAKEKEIDGRVYWGIAADMSQYIVIGIPIKSYGGYDNSENGVIGGISATGTVGIGGFAGYRSEGDMLYFVYQIHASGSLKGSVSIPKNLIAGFPFKAIELASIDMGFYAEANATTAVNKSEVSGSAASVLRQLASNADIDFNAVIGAKVTAGVGDAKCYVRLVYVLGEKGIDFDAGLGSGKSLDLTSYINNRSNSYSVLGKASVDGSSDPVPTIYQASAKTAAVMKGSQTRGASDTVELKLLNSKSVSAKVNDALANSSIIKLNLSDDTCLLPTQITVTDGNSQTVTLVPEVYDDTGAPTVAHANFFADDGMFCFVPAAAGTYTITINSGVNASIDDGEIIVTKAFATLDGTDTAIVNQSTANYKVNDASDNTRYKVQLFLGTEQGSGDYLLAESGELTAADLANAGQLTYALSGTKAPSGTYYPGLLLLEYVEAEDAAGQTLGTWAAVDQIFWSNTTLTYTNTSEIPAPANVTLAYTGNGTMTANWTEVTGGADAYQLAIYEENDSKLEDTGLRFVTENNFTSFIMDLSSLTPGKKYCVGVSAIRYNREDTGDNNIVISPDGKYQNGREGTSALTTMPEAAKPAVSYSGNVKLGEGNNHSMLVPANGSSFVVTASKALSLTVKEKESGTALTVTQDDTAQWTVTVPSQPTGAGSGNDAPFVLEVVAVDTATGDYVLDYITVTPDSIAPPLVVDNMGNFPRWQIESGYYANITGHSEAGAKIYIYRYNKDTTVFDEVTAVYAAEDGSFSLPVQFNGKPLFCVQAEDTAGNKSDPVSISFPNTDIDLNLDLGPGSSSVAGIELVNGSQIGTLPKPVPCAESGVERVFTGWVLHVDTITGVTFTETNVKDKDGNDVMVGSSYLTKVTVSGTEELNKTDVPVEPSMIFRKNEYGKVTVSNLVQGTGENAGKLVEQIVATFDSDPVLYASWSESVTVTFDQGEGASCAEDTRLVGKDKAIGALPTPFRTDGASKVFAGWYTESGALVTASTSVSSPKTFVARWNDVVKVTFDAGIGGMDLTNLNLSEEDAEAFAETGALTVVSGSAIPVYPTVTAAGYAFQGWFTDPDAENAQPVGASTVFTQDTTLTAKWTRNVETFTVTQANGTEGVDLADPVYTVPAEVAAITPAVEPTVSYTRNVSFTDENNVVRTRSYALNAKPAEPGDYTVTVQYTLAEKVYMGTANFSIIGVPHDVSVAANLENGSISADVTQARYGDTVTVTATPGDDYALRTLTVTDSDGNNVKVTYDVDGNTNVCSFTMPARDVSVTAVFSESFTLGASASSNDATLIGVQASVSGPLCEGKEVTLTAPFTAGYEFNGWYKGDKKVSEKLVYTFSVTGNTVLVARYTARGTAAVSITAVNGRFTVTGTNEAVNALDGNYQLGTELTVTAEDENNVLQWENGNGKVLGRGGSLTVTVTGPMTLKLVCKSENSASSAFVQFLSDYDQVLRAQSYNDSDAISFPVPPTKFGYDFLNWIFENTDNEATEDAIKARFGTENIITVKPKYTKKNDTFTVTVQYQGVTRDNDVYGNIVIGTPYTVTAPEIDGYVFQYWKRGTDIIGYNTGYFMQIAGNVTLTAVYGAVSVEAEPIIAITELRTEDVSGTHKVIGVATRSVPSYYTVLEQGMLYGKDLGALTTDTFIYGTAGVKRYQSTDLSNNGVLNMSLRVSSDDLIVYFRGYMKLLDNRTGNEITVYTGISSGSYNTVNANS